MDRMKRVIVLLVLITICAAIGETVVRRTYGDGFLSLMDTRLDHMRRPYINVERTWGSGESFRFITNSLGWRDSVPAHKVEKVTDSQKRIVFLGDSFTEGIGYNQEDVFSGLVEGILREKGLNCEVLNGGTVSYSPLLEYMRLKRFLDNGYKTDLVVLLPDLSDVQDETLYSSKYIFDKDGEPVKFKGLRYNPFLVFLLNRSCFVRSMARSAKNLYDKKIKKESSGSGDEKVITPTGLSDMNLGQKSSVRGNWEAHAPSLAGWAAYGLKSMETNIKRIKRLCDENGIKLVLAIYPWPQQLYVEEDPLYYKILKDNFYDMYTSREVYYAKRPLTESIYADRIRNLCRHNSIDLIDLYAEVIEEENRHEFYISDDIHLNKKGHRFAAEKIAEDLLAIIQ